MDESSNGVLLIVDDEPLKRVTLQIELSEAGYTVFEESDAVAALKILDAHPVDVVITDLRMPGMDGLQFLEKIKTRNVETHVILMTAYGSIDSAVEAIKRGAYDYLSKPFRTELLLEKVDRLMACRKMQNGQGPTLEMEKLGELITRCTSIRRLFERIRNVADNERSVLLCGENGTGKKRVAETVHQLSRRSSGPLIRFCCNGGDSHILDAQLFGSSNGNGHSTPSSFSQADGGTLLIEEVHALPVDLQIKLLQWVEHKKGATEKEHQPDVRILCTTNKDLRQMVDGGRFREDLYFLLCSVNLNIPPLRDRREDIPVLAELFLKQQLAARPEGPQRMTINPHAMDALVEYHWPGNIRELEHVIRRAVAFAEGKEIQPKDIMLPVNNTNSQAQSSAVKSEENTGLTETIAGVERTLINAALRRAAGNQAKAAQFLRIPRTTLRDKMAKYGMFTQSFEAQQPIE